MKKNYSILIADDHGVVRHGISLLLREVFGNLNISHADIFSKVTEMVSEKAFDLIILDIAIPEGKGVKMIEILKAARPEMKILIFSGYEEDLYAIRYLKAGADGFLNKLSSEEEFKTAFRSMVESGSYISEIIGKKLFEVNARHTDNPLENLSNRELEIARLLVNGEGNLEIGNKLGLQNSTVSTYKNRIFEKLEISNAIALVDLFRSYYKQEN